jgi:hypothetical protein
MTYALVHSGRIDKSLRLPLLGASFSLAFAALTPAAQAQVGVPIFCSDDTGNSNFACGALASATGSNTVAVGDFADAISGSTAVGIFSTATNGGTALGFNANANSGGGSNTAFATAVGVNTNAGGSSGNPGTTAIGGGARAGFNFDEPNATAVGDTPGQMAQMQPPLARVRGQTPARRRRSAKARWPITATPPRSATAHERMPSARPRLARPRPPAAARPRSVRALRPIT